MPPVPNERIYLEDPPSLAQLPELLAHRAQGDGEATLEVASFQDKNET